MRHLSRILVGSFVTVFSFGPGSATICAEEVNKVEFVKAPPVEGGNAFYTANRAPLLPSPLMKLPVGSVRPEGWLRGQLERMAGGFTGHLPEVSQWCKFEGSAWASPEGEGRFGWEELPYWLKGFISLGYVLEDERIIRESTRWIEASLSSQEAGGYFGPRENKRKMDLWPNMIMMYALRTHHEGTGDERVIRLLEKYFRWQASVPLEQFLPGSWQKWRAGDNLDSIHWLYNRTGHEWLLGLAAVNHDRTADWAGGFPTWHGVNICQCFRAPAQYYQQIRDVRYLKAAERNYDTVMAMYGQAPGGMFGADENCRQGYTGPRQAAETCSMVELMHSAEMLLTITGNPLWADRCEDAAFNSLPASMSPDLKGLHYLTAPNMIQLDRRNKSPLLRNRGDMLSYNPWAYRCCQHNVAFGWPYFAEHVWMAAADNGLAAVFYAPSRVKAKVGDGAEVEIVEMTDYPFGEDVEFEISAAGQVRFPLLLRIPGWCRNARISVNGEGVGGTPQPLQWAVIDRTWAGGDKVRLSLPMETSVKTWSENRNALSVSHGPLTYSLKIGERWARYGGSDEWPAFEVFPTTPWNYGLIVDAADPASSFEVQRSEGPVASQPFTPDAVPVSLKAKGKRIPEWQQEPNGLIGAIQDSPVRSDEATEELTLIPMGAARLRVSAFPRIAVGEDGNVWKAPPPPPTASHCWSPDSVQAICDGVVPKGSGDQSIPRFTWWDHKGTTEWVQHNWPEPRAVSSCEVYWFDDTGVGHCRVPASWKLLWLDGDEWKPVAGAGEYGIKKDTFNHVAFEAVKTKSLRLEVRLQPEFSSGILEWKVGE